jgi:hypothetical protein
MGFLDSNGTYFKINCNRVRKNNSLDTKDVYIFTISNVDL